MLPIIDALVPTFIAFGFPIVAMIIGYLRFSKSEQKEVRETFLTLKTLFSIGFVGIGLFLISIGDALTLNSVKIIGLLFLLPGTVFTAGMIGKRNKIKGMITLVLIAGVIYLWGVPL
ncbi:hypothetical protein [Bacillus sp. RAR_GA_16]|uniref:hypothetical protein n=1 Tax=Bacillus sp. RAR_GA_16 TaxID=2876774 RepID=UPI001CCC94B1|nr:hypothetical protein [Bacillus sp. RAR_GA_16]MCA0173961.1 hypothetical protein [Bacillus sp. RAR_GA_16]